MPILKDSPALKKYMLNIYDFNKVSVYFTFNPKARPCELEGRHFCHPFDTDGRKLTEGGVFGFVIVDFMFFMVKK